jgi:mannose-6-phosphate isomerase-like protein (cupin superfamily)
MTLERIAAEEYGSSFGALQHIFLVGNLQRPCPHPFFRDQRMELIVCQYEAGDHGRFHWHPEVTEYEFVVEGEVAYREAATGETTVFRAGDLATVPAGVCVERIMRTPSRTLAVKVPSNDMKIHCRDCRRECRLRVESYAESYAGPAEENA